MIDPGTCIESGPTASARRPASRPAATARPSTSRRRRSSRRSRSARSSWPPASRSSTPSACPTTATASTRTSTTRSRSSAWSTPPARPAARSSCATARRPKTVAIVHCVGSRDENTNRWCSRVCCLYSLKLAHLIKEHTDAEVYNFYIDMRTPGQEHGGVLQPHRRGGRAPDPRQGGRRLSRTRAIPRATGCSSCRPRTRCSAGCSSSRWTWWCSRSAWSRRPTPQDVRRMFNMSCGTRGLLPRTPPQAGAGQHLHRRHLPRRLLPGAEGHPGHRGPGGAAAAEACSLIDKGYIEQEPNTAYIRRGGVLAAASPASRSVPTPRSPSTRTRRRPSSTRRSARAAAPAWPPARPARSCRTCSRTRRSSARSKGSWPMNDKPWEPRIVAFFCNWCTYTAADLAGVSRMKYAANIRDHPADVLGPRGPAVHPGRASPRAPTACSSAAAIPATATTSRATTRCCAASSCCKRMLGDMGIEPERAAAGVDLRRRGREGQDAWSTTWWRRSRRSARSTCPEQFEAWDREMDELRGRRPCSRTPDIRRRPMR